MNLQEERRIYLINIWLSRSGKARLGDWLTRREWPRKAYAYSKTISVLLHIVILYTTQFSSIQSNQPERYASFIFVPHRFFSTDVLILDIYASWVPCLQNFKHNIGLYRYININSWYICIWDPYAEFPIQHWIMYQHKCSLILGVPILDIFMYETHTYRISNTTLDYWFPAFYDAAYSHLPHKKYKSKKESSQKLWMIHKYMLL